MLKDATTILDGVKNKVAMTLCYNTKYADFSNIVNNGSTKKKTKEPL